MRLIQSFIVAGAVLAGLSSASLALPPVRAAGNASNYSVTSARARTVADLAGSLGVEHLRAVSARDLAAAGDYRELADRLYRMADNGVGVRGLSPIQIRFRAAGVNLFANDLERTGLAAGRQASRLSMVGSALAIADGLLTAADRYQTTGDGLRSVLTGGTQVTIGALTGAGGAGTMVACDLVFDERNYPTAQPLCNYARRKLFSADNYAAGASRWIQQGESDAGAWMKKPSVVDAITGTGAWLRDGTKGTVETAWGLGVGFGSAIADTATRVLNPGAKAAK